MKRALIATALLIAATASADVTRFASGNPVDVKPRLHGPVLDLVGGGTDLEPPAQMFVDLVRGCMDCNTKLDVVVLRASGADGYNEFFLKLNGVNSVTTFVITDRESASRDDVVKAVRNAEIVFFAGGDQCNYVRYFHGNALQQAVEQVYKRGGGIGGTSAGLAIESELIYDACPNQSAQSKDVLLDPFSADVSLSRFFRWRYMNATITDTHFQQRDRMGRLITFLARAMHDGMARQIDGIGVNERTSVIVDRDGKAHVIGAGPVFIVRGDHKPEICRKGEPLTWRGIKVWRINAGESFDMTDRVSGVPKEIDVIEGKLSGDPY